MAEKLITTAKKPDKLHARRQANKIVRTAEAQTKLINVLGPRYEFRQGGYTRIMKLAKPRKGDKADMAVIEYVDRPGEIRAARPPSFFAGKSLEEIMQALGIGDEQVLPDDEPKEAEEESEEAEEEKEPEKEPSKSEDK